MQAIEFLKQDLKSILFNIQEMEKYIKFPTVFRYHDGTIIDIYYDKVNYSYTDLGETVRILNCDQLHDLDYSEQIKKICDDDCEVEFVNNCIKMRDKHILTDHFRILLQMIIKVSSLHALNRKKVIFNADR